MNVYHGIAESQRPVDGRVNTYTGAFKMVIGAGKVHYGMHLLVPGTLNSLAGAISVMNSERWHTREYILDMVKLDENDPQYREQQISPQEGRELRQVLQQVHEGRIPATTLYGMQVPREYLTEVVTFLEPRIEVGLQSYVEGQTYAPQKIIEQKLRELKEAELREKPGLPTA